ncbi:MAG: quinol:cytochrome C oxidoreductase [Pseudomonadota bacterium]
MKAPDLSRDVLILGPLANRLLIGGGLVGVLGLVAGVLLAADAQALLAAWLLNSFFVLSLVLGGLVFVLIQHLTRAGWSVVVRRLAEGLAMGAPLAALLILPLLFGLGHLYPWADPARVAEEPLVQAKLGYLNAPFFTARVVGYLAIWTGLGWFLFRRSVRQDADGDPRHTLTLQTWSAPGVVLFTLTTTFAGFDLLMSLEPAWYSTIFGVYVFAGALVAALATMILMIRGLQATGRLRLAITPEHLHDLGKLLFGFTIFWAYIAFSQYMLYWYANLPEETVFYRTRMAGGWEWVGLALLVGHFALPLLLLISRHPKRRPILLALGAAWLLGMHWVDLLWLVGPAVHPEALQVTAPEVALGVGMSGLLVAWLALVLRRVALVPVRDPRLPESLTFENV